MDDDEDVRWVASQSPIPALQALIREAERDKKASSASLPPAPSARADATAHRRPLAASANRPPARPAHPAPDDTYVAQEDEPEAVAFVELLRDAFKTLDENSLKKQRLARAREKDRLAGGHSDARPGSVSRSLSARSLTKTSSTSAICRAGHSTSAPQLASSTSKCSLAPGPRGRALAKTASFGPHVDVASGKFVPSSLPSHSLNFVPKPASRPPPRSSTTPDALPSTARRPTAREPTSPDGDSSMQDVIDLTETDTEWEKPTSTPTSRADTTMCMQVDDDDSDTGTDISFLLPDPPPPTRLPAPKPKQQPPQANTASHPPAPTQRTRTGPPPLGMRRAPLLPPSQYSSSQSTKGATVPRFKPPLLTTAGGTANKNVSGTRPSATSAGPPPRGTTTKVAVTPKAVQENRDADSSFDVSFDMDVDALEEAMKAYD